MNNEQRWPRSSCVLQGSSTAQCWRPDRWWRWPATGPTTGLPWRRLMLDLLWYPRFNPPHHMGLERFRIQDLFIVTSHYTSIQEYNSCILVYDSSTLQHWNRSRSRNRSNKNNTIFKYSTRQYNCLGNNKIAIKHNTIIQWTIVRGRRWRLIAFFFNDFNIHL